MDVALFAQARLVAEKPLYLLLDAAQNIGLFRQLTQWQVGSLFDASLGSPLGDASPHLFAIPNEKTHEWLRIQSHLQKIPACGTLLQSADDHHSLLNQLRRNLNIQFADGSSDQLLAFWDPAILVALLGNANDATAYINQAILNTEQQQQFWQGILSWTYADRRGQCHTLLPPENITQAHPAQDTPLELTDEQTELLIEVSVPDQVLYHLQTNQPDCLLNQPEKEHYPFTVAHIKQARDYGLSGMRDLIVYVSLAFAEGDKFDQAPNMAQALERVKTGEHDFATALKELAHD